METFASLREYKGVRLNENKDRFIQKNTVLTDEQKQEVLDFFHSHANLEAKVNNGNWNYNIPYEEFKRVIDSVDTEEKRLKKQSKELRKQTGLEGLTEGTDYTIFKDAPEYIAYRPLTHRGMRVIASNMVEPKLWCDSSVMRWSPKEVLPEGEPMKNGLYPGAKWCVAMETDSHWKSYIDRGSRFVVVCSKNPRVKETFKKVCLVYSSSWELSRGESVTASDASLSNIQNSYLEAVISDLDEIVESQALGNIQKCYCPEKGVYQISKEAGISSRVFLKMGKLDHPVIWEGDFTIEDETIESLVGCPDVVTGNFKCSYCHNLKSLEGAPKEVGGNFWCSNCDNLTSLKGAPKHVGGFRCDECINLTSLKGAPEDIEGDFYCYDCGNLKSLKGAPRKVKGRFHCSNCTSLISLEGAPEYVGRNFDCSYCSSLTSLKGAPEYVGGNFNCSDCSSLTSFKGAPKSVGGNFVWFFCRNLTSLEDAPEYIKK